MKQEIMSWDLYNSIINHIVREIKLSGKTYEHIGTFPRGGYIPAVHIANHLNIRGVYNLAPYSRFAIHNWNCPLLVVDDISDSGETLLNCIGKDIACVAYRVGSKVKPTYFSYILEKEVWIKFPWEPLDSEMKRDRDEAYDYSLDEVY